MNMFQKHLEQEKEKLSTPTPKFKQKQEPIKRFSDEEKALHWANVKAKSSYIDLRKGVDK